jgi:translocation and assembly module TamA
LNIQFAALKDLVICNILWAVMVGMFLFHPLNAGAQETDFVLQSEFGSESYPELVRVKPSKMSLWEDALQAHFRAEGYFNTHIDSVDWESKIVFLRRGPLHQIGQVSVTLTDSLNWIPEASILDQTQISLPIPFTSNSVNHLIQEVLFSASEDGFLSATATFTAPELAPELSSELSSELSPVEPVNSDGTSLSLSMSSLSMWSLSIELSLGKRYSIESLSLGDDKRTKEPYAAYLAGLRLGEGATGIDLAKIQRSLRSSGLHLSVGVPRFELLSDSTAVLVVPTQPRSPGDFDLSVGYLPSTNANGSQLVGSGHIQLNNAFGRGRTYSARISRLPGQSSGVDLFFRDPFVNLLPVSFQAGFQGYQQDSTFSTLGVQAGIGLHIQESIEIGVSVSREGTRPLQGGTRWVNGQQRIGRTVVSYLGVESTFLNLDDLSSPRSGYRFFARIETGQKSRAIQKVVGTDSVEVKTASQQQRIQFEARNFVAISSRFTWLTGLDGRFVISSDLDESELLRFGGTNSLRGYDENQFIGKTVGRVFTELRGYADEGSFAFVFYDLGYVQPLSSSTAKASSSVYPGFGIGFGYRSPVGPVSVSYAMNTTDPLRDGRIHLGLTLGL